MVSNAPESRYAAYGTGNWIFVDSDNDLVIVLRWVDPKGSGRFLGKSDRFNVSLIKPSQSPTLLFRELPQV